MALFDAGRYPDALAALGRALALEPDAPFAGELSLFAGRAARELGRLDAALVHLGAPWS